MDNKILHSVIKITSQSDVDSLEYGLVTALAEILPLRTIVLYKLVNETLENGVEKIVSLTVEENEEGEVVYKWDNELSIVNDNIFLEICLSNRQNITYKNSNNDQMCFVNPLICDEKVIGAIEIGSNKDLNKFKELINSFAKIYGNCLFLINKSERDKLTGLLNRHSFDTKFGRLIKTQQNKQRQDIQNRTKNGHRKLTANSYAWLAIFDIDHFKKINDKYGHVCGDEVLLILSQKIKGFFRGSDLLFRFGGEEFVIILEPIPYKMAERTLERFRKKVAESHFPLVDKITISGGYIRITDSDYPITFIERADQALYYAKKNGRDCVYNYESLVERGELPKPNEHGSVDLF